MPDRFIPKEEWSAFEAWQTARGIPLGATANVSKNHPDYLAWVKEGKPGYMPRVGSEEWARLLDERFQRPETFKPIQWTPPTQGVSPGVVSEDAEAREWLVTVNRLRSQLGLPEKKDVGTIKDMSDEFFFLKPQLEEKQERIGGQQREWAQATSAYERARWFTQREIERWLPPEKVAELQELEPLSREYSAKAFELKQEAERAKGQMLSEQAAITGEARRRAQAEQRAGEGVARQRTEGLRGTPTTAAKTFTGAGRIGLSRQKGVLAQVGAQSQEFEIWRERLLSQLTGPANEVSRWFVQKRPNPYRQAWESRLADEEEEEGLEREQGEAKEAFRAGPPTPDWLSKFAPGVGERLGSLPFVPTPSGQQLTKMAPSESQFLAGAIDWFGGRPWQDILSEAESMLPQVRRGATKWRPQVQGRV